MECIQLGMQPPRQHAGGFIAAKNFRMTYHYSSISSSESLVLSGKQQIQCAVS